MRSHRRRWSGGSAVIGRAGSILPDSGGVRHRPPVRVAAPSAVASPGVEAIGYAVGWQVMTIERVTLRPVAEDDLPVMERFLTNPEAASPFQWFGWWDPGRWRREWAENGLLGDDRGSLMVLRDDEGLGFVGFRKVWPARNTFYWSIGILLVPEARGKGAGTEAQRGSATSSRTPSPSASRRTPRAGISQSNEPWRRPGSLVRASTAASCSVTGNGVTECGTAFCAPIWPASARADTARRRRPRRPVRRGVPRCARAG